MFPLYPALGQEDNEKVRSVVGVDYLPPAGWTINSEYGTEAKIDYDFDGTSFTSYEANVRIEKLKTTLGFNAVFNDKLVGEVDRYAGYVATKNMFFRYSQGKISGSADWTDDRATGMAPTFSFNHSVIAYEINYLFMDSVQSSYFGIGYTAMNIPIQIDTMIKQEGHGDSLYYGKPVYDPEYGVKAYYFKFGLDNLLGGMTAGNLPIGLDYFISSQTEVGAGEGTISAQAVMWAEELNPNRTFLDSKASVFYGHTDTTVGISWVPSYFKGQAVFALGYNLKLYAVNILGGYKKPGDTSELGYDTAFGMMRHGPQFKVYAAW
ncbi:hypothetical protein KKI24_09460 [bacterium]|nr:hypothetical protein [bacterium]